MKWLSRYGHGGRTSISSEGALNGLAAEQVNVDEERAAGDDLVLLLAAQEPAGVGLVLGHGLVAGPGEDTQQSIPP